MKSIETVQADYKVLNNKLKDALSKMELTDKIIAIRDSIKNLQSECPHRNESYDFSHDDECPYCKKKFGK